MTANGHAAAASHTPDDWATPTQIVKSVVADVEQMLRCYCVMPKHAYLPLALWVVATYLSAVFRAFPYIALFSPMKRCGKTRLLDVLKLVCFEPFTGIAPTAPALFRSIGGGQTLLLDEMEILKPSKNASEGQQSMIAILNAGYKRGATVPRCEGNGKEIRVVNWPVFGPKAFATTSRLPSTLADRCIMVTMQRKTADQKVERFREARAEDEAKGIVVRISSFATEFGELIQQAYDTMPDLDFLNDRDAEIWSPLFAVCTVATSHLRTQLIEDAKALSRVKELADADESLALRLLEDVHAVWPSPDTKYVHTSDLLVRLQAMDDSIWKHEIELTSRKLARMLKAFGIFPRQVRLGDSRKGYALAPIQRAVSRYLAISGEISETSETDSMDS